MARPATRGSAVACAATARLRLRGDVQAEASSPPRSKRLGEAHQIEEKDRLLVGAGNERYALAYDFGAVVFVGLEDEVHKRIIDRVLKCLLLPRSRTRR